MYMYTRTYTCMLVALYHVSFNERLSFAPSTNDQCQVPLLRDRDDIKSKNMSEALLCLLFPYFLFRLLRKSLGTFGYELEVWN